MTHGRRHILEMRAITKTFPGVKALQDVNLAVERGEVHAICGENGAGKSTLMKVLSGVYPHGTYEGEILFDGEAVRVLGHPRQRDSGHRHHPPGAGAEPVPVDRREHLPRQRARQRRGAHRLERDQRRGRRRCSSGSASHENPVTKIMDIGVGKQQLVEIAKALSKDVKLLILDEPTAALNDDDSAHLLGLLRGLRGAGHHLIIICHKLNEIKAIADPTTIIRDGKTIETLDMAAGCHRGPDHQGRWSAGTWTTATPTTPPPSARSCCASRTGRCTTRSTANASSSTTPTSTSARGEIVGIAGLMGAGRTELAMSVFGRSYGTNISGRLFKPGKQIQARIGRARPSTTASPTPPRTASSTAST